MAFYTFTNQNTGDILQIEAVTLKAGYEILSDIIKAKFKKADQVEARRLQNWRSWKVKSQADPLHPVQN